MGNFERQQEQQIEHQPNFVLVLGLGIAATIALTACAVATYVDVVSYLMTPATEMWRWQSTFGAWWVVSALVMALVVTVVTSRRAYQFRHSHRPLLESMGAERVADGPLGPKESQALDVVKELAKSIGVPMPTLYYLPGELGVNAFSVGYTLENTEIVVTQGCIERLNRAQFQGVMAHEFGHIVAGETRWNTFALSFMRGILSIALLSQWMMGTGRVWMNAPGRPLGGVLGTVLMAAGIAIAPVGLVGAGCAAVVTAVINRQREYLADDRAVEFVRSSHGIAEILKLLAGRPAYGQLQSRLASELGPLLFARSSGGSGWWFNTHPLLAARIYRLDPNWDGLPIFDTEDDLSAFAGAYQGALNLVVGATAQEGAAVEVGRQVRPGDHDPALAACLDQWLKDNHAEVESQLPTELLEVVDDPGTAPLAVWPLVLTSIESIAADLEHSEAARRTPEPFQSALLAMAPLVTHLQADQRVVMVDRAMRACQRASLSDRRVAASALDLFAELEPPTWAARGWAWLLNELIQNSAAGPPKAVHASLEPLRRECEVVLSALVNASHLGHALGEYAFQRASGHLLLEGLDWLKIKPEHSEDVFDSVRELGRTPAKCRRALLVAASLCLSADGKVGLDEAVLIRVLCRAWGFPDPLVLPCAQMIAGT